MIDISTKSFRAITCRPEEIPDRMEKLDKEGFHLLQAIQYSTIAEDVQKGVDEQQTGRSHSELVLLILKWEVV